MQPKTYYVYHLINSLDGSVFYVGKGTGGRAYQHERNADNGEASYKAHYIRDLKRNGGKVVIRKVKTFFDESMAYQFEKEEINRIGLDNLTNIHPGGVLSQDAVERLKLRQAEAIARKKAKERESLVSDILGNNVFRLHYLYAKEAIANGFRYEVDISDGSDLKIDMSHFIDFVESVLNREELLRFINGEARKADKV